jgi:hypothetical protein
MKSLTGLATLSIVALGAIAPAAPAGIISKVTQPGSSMLATDQPVSLQMNITSALANPTLYTYSAYVWPSGNGPTLEQVPMTEDPANPLHLTGTVNGAHWATKAGTYWIGVQATPKPTTPPTPTPCTQQPVPVPATTSAPGTTQTVAIACPQVSYVVLPRPLFEGIPHSRVTVAPPLTLMWARYVARQKAYKIGWHSTAPLTCTAPYVPSAYACTFRWHTGYGKLVKRTLTVTQDTTTGRVTVKR